MKRAWNQFVYPDDAVGIKANSIAGKLLFTKPEVVDCIIDGLLNADVPKENIINLNRKLFQLTDAGFTSESFLGVKIMGTEMKTRKKIGGYYEE